MGSAQKISSEELFKAWREGISDWGLKYYGKEGWEIEMSSDEITKGVICPYILTHLSPRLGVRARFEIPLRWDGVKNKRMDVVLYDATYKNALAHIEYENSYGHLLGEFSKFIHSEPKLKVMLTITDLSDKESRQEFDEWFNNLFKPAIYNAIETNRDTIWTLVYSQTFDFSQWKGVKFEYKDGEVIKTGLS